MKEDKLNPHDNKESNLFITPPIVSTSLAALIFCYPGLKQYLIWMISQQFDGYATKLF